jgi:predicted permease
MRWPFGTRARDVDDEIRSHLAMAEADRVDRGETPDEARVRARKEFGNVALVTQVTREMSGWTFADRLGEDIRHGWRRLWARPATTCLAIAMLGLAVGITTAMFTLVDAFLLRPFPFQDAERIAPIWMRSQTGGRVSVMPAVYRAWRESGVFESAEAASVGRQVVVETAAGPTMRAQAFVSPGLFAMLGVRAARGRTFDETDGRPGTSDRVAISEDVWRSVFAGDPQIIGRPVRLDGELATVVGVLPRNFRFPEWNTEIWRPSDFVSHTTDLYRLPRVFVKWTHGMPQTDALRVATTLAHGADRDTAELWADVDDQVRAGTFGARYVTTAVPLLAGAIGLMFLALCTNVGGLILARFNARRRDVSLSSALGASRARLLWQASIENVLLGAMGAAVGVAIAYWLVSATTALLPGELVSRTLNPLDVDERALLVAVLLAVVATAMAGLLPAWVGMRGSSAHSVLARTSTESRATRRLSRAFLVTEVALACALVAGATLLVRSFMNLAGVDPGFNPSGVVSVWAEVDISRAPDAAARQAVTNAAVAELSGLPGVMRVVRSSGVPMFFSSGRYRNTLLAPVDSEGVRVPQAVFQSHKVGPEWFETFGVRILRGRAFRADDDIQRVILGARLASTLWPSVDPVGRSLRWGKEVYQVVGVADDLRSPVRDLETDFAEIYVPFDASTTGGTISLQCGNPCPSEGLIRQRLSRAAPALMIHRFGHLETIYNEELAQPRAMATLGFVFGTLALVVAAGGLFGVLSHTVGRRRREFGIRLVLGSTPGEIRRLVLREGLVTAGIGIALGAAGAWTATSALAALLYGVTATDAWSWSLVLVTLVGATMAGAWQPAARATRIDPSALLREE